MSIGRRWCALATVLACLITTGPAVAAGPDQGRASRPDSSGPREPASRASTITQYQSGYRMAWVPEFNLCLGIYVRGNVQATSTYTTTVGGQVHYKIYSPKLINPYMLVTTRTKCDDSAGPKKRHTINTLTYRMYAYGYSCSYNPTYSVAAPWGASAGVTPDCGSKKVASYGQTQSKATKIYRYELATQGFAMGWNQSDADSGPGYSMKLCTSISTDFRLVDNVGPAVKTINKRVQLPDFCVVQRDPSGRH